MGLHELSWDRCEPLAEREVLEGAGVRDLEELEGAVARVLDVVPCVTTCEVEG